MTKVKGQAGGLAVKAKYGHGHFVKIGREGGHKVVATYGISYMHQIASTGGMTTALRGRRRLYDSGVSLQACLGGD